MNFLYNLLESIYLSLPNNLAYYDQLTGVHNRNYYERVLKNKYLPSSCLVVFIDVNDLKKTNDTFGHAEGSRKIVEVCSIIQQCNYDALFRYGGDEFILFFEKELDSNSIQILEKQKLFCWGSYRKEPYEDISSAIRKADLDMYSMKQKYHENN